MISPITRRLLRDWKRLAHTPAQTSYHVRPQEANVHLWHFVLTANDRTESETNEFCGSEIYGMFFVGGSDTEPVVLMRCFTPNACFPVNKTVSLSHLAPLLLGQGLSAFLEHLQRALEYADNSIAKESGTVNSGWHNAYFTNAAGTTGGVIINSQPVGNVDRFTRAWNRIMLREFKLQFPALYVQFAVTAQDRALVQQWAESNARREVPSPRPARFTFKDHSPATTLACDSDSHHSKRRKIAKP
ncbi:LAQU0S12e03136g1_1 [Lachancea quebecensis]|uniref:LAQU0S12e03136g1_1 n=1 Tax=Lachancea quebecensis TaxID=1654605 RepID=A0A0N7MM27_9SACH|nr:LAQU0S12e03136g1_1 [Lachancea quebecensis]